MALKSKVKKRYVLVVAGPLDRHLAMFKGKEDQAKPVVVWAIETLKKDDKVVWFLKNYRSKPEVWNEDNKVKLEHFMSMAPQIKDIEKMTFDAKWTIDEGLKKLEDLEQSCLCNLKSRGVALPGKGVKLLDLGSGLAWWDLKTPSDKEEGAAMGHCGNTGTPHANDTVLSLREEKKIGPNVFYTPHLTFILNQGVLGEMKGKANEKPKKKYHKAIVELLKHPSVEHIWGGGYQENRNFSLSDLTKEDRDELVAAKPGLDLTKLVFIDNKKVDTHKKHGSAFLKHNSAVRAVRDHRSEKASKDYREKHGIVVEDEIEFLFRDDDHSKGETKHIAEVNEKPLEEEDLVAWLESQQVRADKLRKAGNHNHAVLYADAYPTVLKKLHNQDILKEHLTANPGKYSDAIQIAALENLTDQDALKEFVMKTKPSDHVPSPAFHAVHKIEDKDFLTKIVRTVAYDDFFRATALDKVNDRALDLEMLADEQSKHILEVVFSRMTEAQMADVAGSSKYNPDARLEAFKRIDSTSQRDVVVDLAKIVTSERTDNATLLRWMGAHLDANEVAKIWDTFSVTVKHIFTGIFENYATRWEAVPIEIASKVAFDRELSDRARTFALQKLALNVDRVEKELEDFGSPLMQEKLLNAMWFETTGYESEKQKTHNEIAGEFLGKVAASSKYEPSVRLRAAILSQDPDHVMEALKVVKKTGDVYKDQRDIKQAFAILEDDHEAVKKAYRLLPKQDGGDYDLREEVLNIAYYSAIEKNDIDFIIDELIQDHRPGLFFKTLFRISNPEDRQRVEEALKKEEEKILEEVKKANAKERSQASFSKRATSKYQLSPI